jgi:ribosomal protein S18 acetylase RimI-like enzyme
MRESTAAEGRIHVRRAAVADVGVAAEVQCASAIAGFAHIFPTDAPKPTPAGLAPEWRALFDAVPPAVVLLADADGVAAGVAVARVPEPEVGSLSKLYVRPEHWTTGIGNLLLDAAVEVLLADGCSSADLWVLEHNRRARAWYERHGWRPTGRRRAPFPDLDLLELEHRLILDPSRQPPSI